MPSRKSGALSEFHRSTHRVTSTESFIENFHSLCRKSDRHGMIKILMEIEQVKNLRIEESYHQKNDKEAEQIFEIYQSIAKNKEQNRRVLDFLTRALFAASPRSAIFKEILWERARFWYSAGFFTRCLKDCDYLIYKLNENANGFCLRDKEINAECTELRSKCIETMKRSVKRSQKSAHPRIRNINSIVALPRIDAVKTNTKMPSCSDSLSLSYDKMRGRHLVATRNIKVGSVVMIDKPFSFSTDIEALATNCLHCHVSLDLECNVRIPCDNCQTVSFCSNDCRLESWQKYHKYECNIFDYFYETNVRDIDVARQHRSHLLLAWRTTIESLREKANDRVCPDLLNFHEASAEREKLNRQNNSSIDPYDPLHYSTVFALETHCSEAPVNVSLSRSLRSIFFAKCFELVFSQNQSASDVPPIDARKLLLFAVGMLRHTQSVNCNAYEIVENTRDDNTKIWEPRNVGGAIYPTVSLTNHACYPNIVRHSYPNGRVVVRALRFIAKGEEILDCYGPHFVSDSISHRRRYLQDKYHFTCSCEACANDLQLPDDTSMTLKCSKCNSSITQGLNHCTKCHTSIDIAKKQALLAKSVKKRVTAIAKMFDGNYVDALPILLEHAALLEKLVVGPSLETIKTQQSIIQCYNSLSCVAPSSQSL